MLKDYLHIIGTYSPLKAERGHGVSFYKTPRLPDGWFTFGHYGKLSGDQQRNAYVLVARDATKMQEKSNSPPPVELPLSYNLIWTSGTIFVWKPNPPLGYRALGCVVTTNYAYGDGIFPDCDLIRCVRDDLTEYCELDNDILGNTSTLKVFNIKESKMGMLCKGVTFGMVFCSTDQYLGNQLNSFCLRFEPKS